MDPLREERAAVEAPAFRAELAQGEAGSGYPGATDTPAFRLAVALHLKFVAMASEASREAAAHAARCPGDAEGRRLRSDAVAQMDAMSRVLWDALPGFSGQ